MDLDAYRALQLLTEISSGDSVTQRRLAQKYGLALGLTNFLLRRLVKKGHVKIINLKRNRLRYLLTPKGVTEKARLTYEYLEYSLALYRHMRTFMTETLAQVGRAGGRRVVVYGTGELAEISVLAMQERGLEVVAVLEESGNGRTTFMNQPVRSLAALSGLDFDRVVIATFKDPSNILHQLQQAGVPPTKIATMPNRSALGRLNPVIGPPTLCFAKRSMGGRMVEPPIRVDGMSPPSGALAQVPRTPRPDPRSCRGGLPVGLHVQTAVLGSPEALVEAGSG